ncbi:type 2 periplasmic-binding domain-containing protein [Alkalicoccobacillus murimartini]|uniref:Aldouronate transport system substrate-binding protein n=1 Tax=Alkalicoccobacillus murimartini TaxID=171685 RepID=A0ABT9YCY8_9BACI|nr:extracellular solute-binding protein [Alkalicoccobacillus murimartini]MDQ0205720.1 putative aldouronate transport system substrate-binding protein [Alkalicoccobacillus murimartini]
MNKLLKVSMLASVLAIAACSNNEAANKESKLEPVESASELPEKFEEPVTLDLIKHVSGDIFFRDGETIEDNVHTKWVKDTFNIDLNYMWTTSGPEDTFDTKLQLSMSANEELPSILALRSEITQDLIDSGRVKEVGEIFEKYASQTWKDAMEADPHAWDSYTREDGRYAIPILDYEMNGDTVLFIRQDWLDKLNLDGPETMDDVEGIMDAFVNEDPTGTGETTYGLAVGFANALNTWMSTADWVFGAYGAMPDQWNLADNGMLEHGSIQPEVKEGLETMRNWMEEGYIHPESGLWDEGKAGELFTSGRAGIIAGPHWMPDWPLSELLDNVDGAEFKAYEIPTGPNGFSGRSTGITSQNGSVMINENATEEEIQAFFVYQNYLFENYANPEVGSEFEYGFAEGYDYSFEGDEVKYRDDEIPGGRIDPVKYTLTFDGARIPSLYINTLADFARGDEPETPFEHKMYLQYPEEAWEGAKIVVDGEYKQIPGMFTGAPTPTMLSRQDTLDTMLSESFSKMIYGELSLDEFDSTVEKWKSSGGEDITKEVNEWYETVEENRE